MIDKHEAMGKKVTVYKVYKKFESYDGISMHHGFVPETKENGVEGWIIGFRTIPLVEVKFDRGESKIKSTGGIHCALVTSDPHAKGCFVPMEEVERALNDKD